MADSYVVFCTRSAGALLPEQLAGGVLATDLADRAEERGINPKLVDLMLSNLVGENTDFEGFNAFRLCNPDRSNLGIVRVDRCHWSADAMSAALADLQYNEHPSHLGIRHYMVGVIERLEVTIDVAGPMASVIRRAAALCLASWYGGLVEAPDNTWWTVNPDEGFCPFPEDPVTAPPAGARTLRYAKSDLRTSTPVMGTSIAPQPVQPILPVAPTLPVFRSAVPRNCPSCKAPLYPTGRAKPEPALPLRARVMMGIGIVVGVIAWLGTGLWLRFVMDVWIPGKILGLVLFPIAFFPALGVGLLAHRVPKVLNVSCSRCSWREGYVWEQNRK